MSGVTAQLSVRRGCAAVAFYEAAFGAVEVYRVGGTDQHEPVVAQLAVGDTTFWVADESPEHGNHSPESLGGGTVKLLLTADDGQQTGQQTLQDDAGGERILGGDDHEAAEHPVGVVRRADLEAGEA